MRWPPNSSLNLTPARLINRYDASCSTTVRRNGSGFRAACDLLLTSLERIFKPFRKLA
ncbi:hypothetical protein M419DRAFT_125329 [Trichoderma reesei RUT C-30]|uniref:Uncharacterized protein n=1 Tax=Hypocrea jecorina (strain ATCC 56765 / BCRC 32924 / NRRL 11460 / Rut C-30) TaxID=1344414 RepID=A0A024RZA7_HYPJR|nr:hypothetical protein M419DRAFT_125329 [Trichoderma reesei RUT C-30]